MAHDGEGTGAGGGREKITPGRCHRGEEQGGGMLKAVSAVRTAGVIRRIGGMAGVSLGAIVTAGPPWKLTVPFSRSS